jgi:hypothetical protein
MRCDQNAGVIMLLAETMPETGAEGVVLDLNCAFPVDDAAPPVAIRDFRTWCRGVGDGACCGARAMAHGGQGRPLGVQRYPRAPGREAMLMGGVVRSRWAPR